MGKPKSSYALWITGHVVRLLFVLLIFAMCGLLLWRVIFSQNAPDDFDQITGNDTLRAALAEQGDLTVMTQYQTMHTEGRKSYVYFDLDYCYFFKEADQVQLLLRYNNSVVKNLAADLGLESVPSAGEEVFSPRLTQILDVTPADYVKASENDILTEECVITPSAYQITSNSLYTFIRYTFDGVDVEEDTVVIYLDMYYGEGEAEESYGTMRLYHRLSENRERPLSKKERKIIAE